MGGPAVVKGDEVTGNCAIHVVPAPNGGPMPSPAPLSFSAPLTTNLATSVEIEGKPAAIRGSKGTNTPPHSGLHASDPYLAQPQQGQVVSGSRSVTIEGSDAAYSGCPVAQCGEVPAQVSGSASSVEIGS